MCDTTLTTLVSGMQSLMNEWLFCRMIATLTKIGEGAFADVFGCQKEGWDKLAVKVSSGSASQQRYFSGSHSSDVGEIFIHGGSDSMLSLLQKEKGSLGVLKNRYQSAASG